MYINFLVLKTSNMKFILIFVTYFTLIISTLLQAQPIDSTIIRRIDSLINVSRDLMTKNEITKSIEINQLAREIAVNNFGTQSAEYAKCCFDHGRILDSKGELIEAEKLYLEAKDIREKVLGKENLDYAWSLVNLGIIYAKLSQFYKAEPLFLEAKSIRQNLLSKEHPDYINILNNLGNLYMFAGKFEKSEPLFTEVKYLREKLFGKENRDYASILNNLGLLYWHMGKYDLSEQLFVESLRIKVLVHDNENPGYAMTLSNLALVFWRKGQYEKAEYLNLKVIELRKKILGPKHPDYATSLNNLAIIYMDMGQLEKAELLYNESITITEEVFGIDNPEYANRIHNLANLYCKLNLYENAETLYLRAKSIREKVIGKEHPSYAKNLSSLATLYMAIGQLNRCEILLKEEIEIIEKVLGKNHYEYAISLNNLANLYCKLRQFEKAETLFIESKNVMQNSVGINHNNYATSLVNLASLYFDIKKYEESELIYLEAKNILFNTLGFENFDYITCLYNLAKLFINKGNDEEAGNSLLEISLISQKLIQRTLHHLSELEIKNYMSKFIEYKNQLFSFTQLRNSKTLNQNCYNNNLFFKGFLQYSSIQTKKLAFSDSTTAEKYNLLKSYSFRLSKEYSKPIADRDSILVVEIEDKSKNLEKEIARNVAGYREAQRQVDWREVQSSIKSNNVAVEFVHYKFYYKKETDSVMYAALVLLPKREGSSDSLPLFIPLFEQRQLDGLIKADDQDISALINNLYYPIDNNSGTKLYQLIWKPIIEKIGDSKTIFYSPSGLLHRINLGAIVFPESKLSKRINYTMSDRFKMVNLNSTRDLVVTNYGKYVNKDAVIYGGVNYNWDSSFIPEPTVASLGTRGTLSFQWTDTTLRTNSWNELPNTKKEALSIAKLFDQYQYSTQQKSGIHATEESFKFLGDGKKPSPRILHLATHGYFFPDAKTEPSKFSAFASQEPVFKISEHPMLRSGLIMAGGNSGWKGEKTLEGREDGVLTAFEISQLDLSHTELVVLSACETGLGDIQGFEGVYGLQRAFKIAGIKNIIMSLWQVDDEATSILMQEFYKNLLSNNKSIYDALASAQHILRNSKKFSSPYYWAGWVLLE